MIRRAFTLTEMMVAVAVLIVVIVAVSRIFATASQVTGLGTAASDILQETGAIERQLRDDLAKITPEGILGIRCVAVRNDLNVGAGRGLLNPALPADGWVRCDQIFFFANGVESIQTYRQGAGLNRRGQGTVSRVYYGHAFQLPQSHPAAPEGNDVMAFDPAVVPGNAMVPWYVGSRDIVRTRFAASAGASDYQTTGFSNEDVSQPPARRWVLARQPVVLVDDGGEPTVHLFASPAEGGIRTARTIDENVVINGRVDGAATQLNDIRRFLTVDPFTNAIRPWVASSGLDQRDVISSWMFYPRAERVAPSMHRVDQALTDHVLASACSSFIVDWTYPEGAVPGVQDTRDVGFRVGPSGTVYPGVQLDPALEQPWFGLDPDLNGNLPSYGPRGVARLTQWMLDNPQSAAGRPIFPAIIETVDNSDPIILYEAFFGFNREMALDLDGTPNVDLGYTPWPSAIRITMTVHDTDTRLESGRELQFVIELPARVRGTAER